MREFLNRGSHTLDLSDARILADIGMDLAAATQEVIRHHPTEALRVGVKEYARLGGIKKNAPYEEIKKELSRLYKQQKKWPSIRQAAIRLAPQIIKFSQKTSRPLAPDNAQETVYRWLRQLEKSVAPASTRTPSASTSNSKH